MHKLFQADPKRLGRPAGPPMADALPDYRVDGSPPELRDALVDLLGADQVLDRLIDLVRYASDASAYRYVPNVVVKPRTPDEMMKLLSYCRINGRKAVFRAAGTSLNGQSQGDDILIDVRAHWQGCSVEADGDLLRTKPGTILGHANARLARFKRKLGPDPASHGACTIGGVIANNAGGMRCTLDRDAYHTLADCTFILPSGTLIDTGRVGAEARFAELEPELAEGLMALRAELIADTALAERVRHKYAIRNTHGYRLCALLDGETPLQIFKRLLVGSEGTLAFIADATLRTVPLPSISGVAFVVFPTIDAAVTQVPELVARGASAVELMVAPALTAASAFIPGTPSYWAKLDPKAAALLVEFSADSEEELAAKEAEVTSFLEAGDLVRPVEFTSLAEAVELAWHVREGLLGLVGKQRPAGTTLLTEDVCFPPHNLAAAAHDLQALLERHGFPPGIAGHAAHGNLHFMLVAKLDEEESRQRYSAFMLDLVELVGRKYDGSLKAEHGTGINMAPFVEAEWGEKATAMMWRIKQLADPEGVLGPNVILTRDKDVHLKALKSIPSIEATSDATQCIECGFCEPVCPSRNVTTTPRQRIVIRREMARQAPRSPVLTQLQEDYEYDAIETCAGDGMCSTRCPIGINTGSLMRSYRRLERSERSEAIALGVARRWALVERVSRVALGATLIAQKTVGLAPLRWASGAARAVISPDLIPTVPGPMPRPGKALPKNAKEDAAAVYFPACINRIFGRDPDCRDAMSLPEALLSVSERAGRPLWIPPDVRGLCCATPFGSKGFDKAHGYMASRIADAFWRWSDDGTLPVVVDAVSCTHGLIEDVAGYLSDAERANFAKVRIVDSTEWCRELLPNLNVEEKLRRVVLHPTCSMTHLNLTDALKDVAQAVAEEVEIPIGAGCCGTAGDRGLLHPELVRSATRDELASLSQDPADAYLSANRTCEMGMLHATGRSYESFIYSLERQTRPPTFEH
ncbi:FAD-binding and (Fe-S)-binding domain-containing protein [Sphingomonas sp. M1-B02]|uniref:FAD-binding and (Fe-S)-binding domain-containing protein n=1 Tax=Sphingomonas sp. M1-B02 TaxID=3114300 RepID=UPI00223F9182|nr:FAD-binding and (Fe-S)-binding domain-containing protein [Sphingomonas sp. S6-11]UZK66318.1 FAD-binding oxidoreductase [Sphingomonas sp. S6-11]